jgi:FKBP-type peptidyl-prolyl cis-trans isomerase (trigger factor)
LEIGSNRLIPGFEDQLIGHSVGETFPFSHHLSRQLPNRIAGRGRGGV